MMRVSALALTFLLLLFVAGSPAQDVGWRKFRSQHFEIYTAASEKAATRVLDHLERVRTAYELLTNAKVMGTQPASVVLFRNKKEYAPYAYGEFSDAYYMNARGRDHIVLSEFDAQTERVLNHEYFHLFSKRANFNLPVWLEEGLADYYSTLRVTDKDVSLGLPVQGHLLFLNSFEGSPVPLEKIFAFNSANRHGANHRATLLLYAQGWALTHMTFLGKDMAERSGDFFRELRSGTDTAAAYQKVYGLSVKDLDRLLLKYLGQRAYQFSKQPLAGLDQKATVEEVPVEEWETPLLLADLQTFVRRSAAAAASYEELAQRFPAEPAVDESRGYHAILDLDREGAARYFESAASKNSTNGRIYYQLANLRCNFHVFEERCNEWIDQAIRLDPSDREARKWAIGYTLNGRQFESALAHMAQTGPVKSTDAPEFFFQFAYASANLGRIEEARAAIRRGLEYASSAFEVARLEKLASMVDSAAEYQEQVETFKDAPDIYSPPANEAVNPATESDASDDAGESMRQDTSDAALEAFLSGEGNTVTLATMQQMDCREDAPTLLVLAKDRTLRLAIDDASSVSVFRDGTRVDDHQFSCGKLPASPLLVGYHTEDLPEGTDGRLRIISFQ